MGFTKRQHDQFWDIARNLDRYLREIHVPTAGGNRRFGDIAAPFQWERFNLLAPAIIAVASGTPPPANFYWIEATKGASKDSDLALLLIWLLLVSPRALRMQIGAADEEQASEIRLIIRRVLMIGAPFNQWISEQIEVLSDRIVNRRTESTADILTTESRSAHGSRPDLVLINELSHVGDREFAETLLDNADKVATSVCIAATNAGWLNTWQHEWRENAIHSPRWQAHIYSQPAPWISEERLAESRRRNSKRYLRLWAGVWGLEGEGDAIHQDDLEAAFTLDGPLAAPERGWIYMLGGDLGTAHDASVLCVLGKHVGCVDSKPIDPQPAKNLPRFGRSHSGFDEESLLTNSEETQSIVVEGTGALKLAALSIFRPGANGGRVDLTLVEREIARLYSIFRFLAAPIDAWQAEQLVSRSQQAGIPAELTHASGSVNNAIAETVLSAFVERRISLWRDPALVADLQRLSIVERGENKVRLISPKSKGGDQTGHGDTCSALGLALVAARRFAFGPPATFNGPLVCWP